MNNKGQSLVTFVLILPIILLILFTVYDIGNMVLLKNELDNINYIAINYGLDKLDDNNLEEKLNDIIVKNKEDIDNIQILIENNEINILLEDRITNKLSLIKKINAFNAKSNLVGYIQDEKKIIKKK